MRWIKDRLNPRRSSAAAPSIGERGFRRDINGLRALAVTAVVLFHFNIAGFSGGFAGVDIFFVISGFLMSGIIASGLQKGNFSTLAFYWSRAKRIVPALVVVSAALLILGWFYLAPGDYKMLGTHVRQSLFFLSNMTYLRESGYFDTASHSKWLLHTWSLSVEWQFYLVLPIFLAAVWKVFPGKKAMTIAHLVALVGSLVACIVLTHTAQQKAFYLLPTRAWEMLLGGLCCLLLSNIKVSSTGRRLMEGGGLLLMVASVFMLDASNAWPGYLALIPTVGTVLVLAAKREGSLWSNNPITEWLGMRSYSLYLWHWPLVAGLFYFAQQDNETWIGGALLLALVLSELSYRLVEQPMRRGLQRMTLPRAVTSLLVLFLIMGGSAQYVVRKNGVPVRMPAQIVQMEKEAQSGQDPRSKDCFFKGAPCVYGGPDVKAILIGDSHAQTLIGVARDALPGKEEGIYFQAAPGCLPVQGLNGREHDANDLDDPCIKMKGQIQTTLQTEMDHVPLIVINRTSMYPLGYNGIDQTDKRKPQAYAKKPFDAPSAESLDEFAHLYIDSVCTLAKTRPVFVMRPLPEMRVEVTDAVSKGILLGHPRDFTLSREDYKARNDFVWGIQDKAHEQCGVQILDPLPYLCDDKVCYGSRNGTPLYADDNHLNALGSHLLVPMFAKAFSSVAHQQQVATLPELKN